MIGEYRHTIDNKGRIFIPAKIREEIGKSFFLTISSEQCLCLYSAEEWQDFSKRSSSMSISMQNKMRPFFAHASKCELDSQGRIIIPANLRKYASLSKDIIIIGNNNHAEIWDSKTWDSIIKNEINTSYLCNSLEDISS